MNQNTQPVYVNSIYIKQNPKFEGLNLNVKVEEFVKFLQEHTNEKGYCNLNISPRKTVSEFGLTHFCKLNTWEPNQVPDRNINTSSNIVDDSGEECDDLPF